MRGRFVGFATWAAGLVVAAAGLARADMVLSDVIVDLQAPEEMRWDIEVWNSGEAPLFVEVTPARVVTPATDESVREPLDDPRKASLLASPKRLAVGPDERKRVRLVAREVPTDEDLVYRVAFVPKENKTSTTQALAFKVLVGYEVLVIVRPPGARPELSIERDGRQLRFANEGRSSILVRKLEACPGLAEKPSSGEEAACVEIPGNRLYAGEAWEVDLPGDGPVRVFESYRSENRVRAY